MERKDWISVADKLPELEQECVVARLIVTEYPKHLHIPPDRHFDHLVGIFLASGVWDDGEYEIEVGPNVWWIPVVDPIEIEEG